LANLVQILTSAHQLVAIQALMLPALILALRRALSGRSSSMASLKVLRLKASKDVVSLLSTFA